MPYAQSDSPGQHRGANSGVYVGLVKSLEESLVWLMYLPKGIIIANRSHSARSAGMDRVKAIPSI